MKKAILLISTFLLLFLGLSLKASAIEGIDVSEWQGDIDFSRVKNAGIEIVYIRSSSGNSYVDSKFEENYRDAKRNNLKVGFYHYVTARNTTEAKEQARFFASVIAGKQADCRLAMDYEVFTGLSRSEVNEISREFLKTLKELTNKDLVIYSDAFNAIRTFDNSLFREYPLWVAEYGVERPEARDYIGWQYSDAGRIDGIEDRVDRDRFKNEIYLNDSETIRKPNISDNTTKKIYHRVRDDDNITKIARKYNTTPEKIRKENPTKDINNLKKDEVIEITVKFDFIETNQEIIPIYVVKKYNTSTWIANKFRTTIKNLTIWNNIKNPNLIYTNEILKLREYNNDIERHVIKYTVTKGNTLTELALKYKTTIRDISSINNIKNINKIYIDETLYIPEFSLYID